MSFTTYNDGTVQTGIILALGAGQYLAGAEIERSTNSSSGSWESVATIDDISETGTAFIDLLPLDNKTRWYRVRHVEPGYATGPWSSVISGLPTLIPDEDFTGKVFTRSNSTNLSLVFVPISESSTVLRVSSSLNYSPAGGTPSMSVASSRGVSSVAFVSTGVYDITKLTSGSGYVTFKNSLAGFVDDFDTVNVGNQQDALLPYLGIRASVTAQSSTQLTVSCSVDNPLNVPGATLSYVVQPTGAVNVTGTNPYTVTRPVGSGSAMVVFTAAQTGFIADSDPVVITPTPLPAIAVRSDLVSVVGGTYIYSIRGIDPIPESNITFSLVGTNASVTPTSVVTASNAAFTVSIVPTSLGNGRVTIRATSPRRSDGVDAIDITAQEDVRAAVVSIVEEEITSLGLPYFAFRALANSTTRDVEVWVTEELAAPSATQSLNYDVVSRRGYQLPGSPYTRNILTEETTWSTSVFASKPSSWVTVTLIPIDGNGAVGTGVNKLYPLPASSPSAPSAFTARANTSTTSTTTTNTVTLPASNLPTSIRVYRDGSVIDTVTVTVGASVTQTLVHAGLLPNTLYTWEYAPVLAGVEGTKTSALNVTTAAAQLVPPTGIGAGLVGNRIRFIITDASSYPAGTTFQGDYNIGGSWLALNVISGDTLESIESYSTTVSGNARFRAANPSYTTSNNSSAISFTANGLEV